jgi:CDP-glucose 4,6-dehydratase
MTFWRGRRVFLTGHTGFKGAWLSLWLSDLGAEVTGYALPPPTTPSLFDLARVEDRITHVEGDVRDLAALTRALQAVRPEVVFHMAAQALVRASYDDPVGTYATNVMGTVNLLEAARLTGGVRGVVCVTSDKCYENRETTRPYRENDAMGGFDPYSSSKGCSELVVSAYRRSYFSGPGDTPVASARAGNVIGGGDWAKDRLVPDLLNGFVSGTRPLIRFPSAVRPWQHVLEPLAGYLRLAEALCEGDPGAREGWNFGPDEADARPVGWIADRLAELWGEGAAWDRTGEPQPHEAHYLKLDCAKARERLGWRPVWSLDEGLARTVAWRRALKEGADMGQFSLGQIRARQSGSPDAAPTDAELTDA